MSAQATAAFLHELLNQPPPEGRYRELWVGKAEKPRKGELSQAAVARVITEHLASKGHPAPNPRQLRSLVSRALAGTNLTKETLALFIDAFEMAEIDAQVLWLLFRGATFDQLDGSRTFQRAVEDVDALIRAEFPAKKRDDTRTLAERIVARLIDNNHLRP